MPDTIDTIVPEGTPTKVKPAGRFLPLLAGRLKPLLAGRFLPLLQPDESRGSHLPSHFPLPTSLTSLLIGSDKSDPD